jgi:hypothetical protein
MPPLSAKRRRAVPRVVSLAMLALFLGGCCGGGSASSTEGGNATTRSYPRGVIAAPVSKAGNVQRGIVRAAPNFQASEVTRLDNGTEVAITQRLSAGWLHVQWPYPNGGMTGYIHQD